MTILKWDISNGDTIVSLASVSQGDMKDRPPCSSAWKGESEHSYSASQQCITLEISGEERNDTRGKLRSRPFLQQKSFGLENWFWRQKLPNFLPLLESNCKIVSKIIWEWCKLEFKNYWISPALIYEIQRLLLHYYWISILF